MDLNSKMQLLEAMYFSSGSSMCSILVWHYIIAAPIYLIGM